MAVASKPLHKMMRTLFMTLFISCSAADLLNVKDSAVKLPPCEVCKLVVESFKKGMERTSRGNFAGGDTAWEEERLGSYHRSEIRLVEIQEKLCLDIQQGTGQCHSLAEEAEVYLETWWFSEQDSSPELLEWLCIQTMELCCSHGHYGSNCEKCPGYPDKICNNNGTCEGAGTRHGTGHCICNHGYAGKLCDKCAHNYFQLDKTNDNIICSPCHFSCEGGCSGPTSKECIGCKLGWQMFHQIGCVDVNECNDPNVCKENEICNNKEGSFTCQVAEKYGTRYVGNWTRYLTVVIFCIAVYVFIRKSILLGSLVAIVAAIYISVNEVVLNSHTDLSKLDIGKLLGIS